jgi:hypothetical protein
MWNCSLTQQILSHSFYDQKLYELFLLSGFLICHAVGWYIELKNQMSVMLISRITDLYRHKCTGCILFEIFHYIENLSPNGTANQSSDYLWVGKNIYLTADLAITGGPTNAFVSESCSVTLAFPIQYVAWWILTFPVDAVYITNVKIYYRDNSKFPFHWYILIKFSFLIS